MTDPIPRLNSALAGRYQVERELGEGGMANVYLATDLRHQRKVALKVLKPELAAAVGAQRFLLEIKTTANLGHPHILPLFDSGEADTFLFYVMPYVEGESLRERLDRDHQLPVHEAVRLATNVAEALDHAHRQGVIHRDIKPENILLQDGKPVIADFGIALALRAARGDRLTETGLSLGTPHYMSPEQATGDSRIGPATDIYALGCVLYEMLAGEPPHTGPTPQAILGKIIQVRPDPVTQHRSSVPANVEAAIELALEKVPADRFATAQDFAKALSDPGFRHRARAPGGLGVGGWRRMAAAGWAAAVVALGIAAWALLQDVPAPSAVSRLVLGTEGWAGIEAPFGHLAAIAPDGSSMVLPLGSWPTAYRLGLKQLGSTEIVPIAETDSARDVIFSPDGQWIGYARGNDLFKRRLSGGAAVKLAEDVDESAEAIAWLDDGTILFEQLIQEAWINTPSRIVRIPEDGGAPVQIIELTKDKAPHPIWMHGLPGARGALVVSCAAPATCRAEGADLYVLDLERRSFELVMQRVMRAWYVPGTAQVVFARPDGAVFAMPFDLANLKPGGGPVPLLDGVRVGGNQVDMVMGGDGTVLYVEGHATAFGLFDLVWVDRSGNEKPLDSGPPRGFTTLALSRDDRLLAVSIETVQASEIWLKELPDGPLTRLTGQPGITRWPFWGRDASTVSYINNDGGTPHVRRVRADGGSADGFEVVLRREVAIMEGVYTPADSGLIFCELPTVTSARLGLLDLTSRRVTEEPRNTGLNERAIALSEDGRWLAFVSSVTGRGEVYVRRVPDTGGRVQVSTNGGAQPIWAHNGHELFYREPSGGLLAATFSTGSGFKVQSRQRLFDASRYSTRFVHKTYDVTRDDQRFVFLRPAAGNARLVLIENWFEEARERKAK